MTARRLLGATLAMLASAGLAHAERVSSGPSELRGPDLLVLGRDGTAELTLRALPAGATLVTNVGELELPRRDGAVTRVILKLPAQRFPQLAIVAVVALDGAVVDWLALPLAGQANTRITTNPGASVVVKVRDREFGPVRADARGIAHVPIVVPPGVADATSVATTSSGQREQNVNLGVRAFARTLAVCAPTGDRAVVVATETDGSPAKASPAISASDGTLAVAQVAPGVFVAQRTSVVAAAVAVHARFDGEDAVAASCQLQTPARPPHRLALSSDRAIVVAGGEAMLRLEPHYTETARRLEIVTLELETDAGTITPAARGDDGAYRATLQMAQQLAGKNKARITARVTVEGGATVRAALAIDLASAPAAALSVDAVPPVRADGRARRSLDVRLIDRFGNAVEQPIEVWRGGERIATLSSSSSKLSYTAPRSHEAVEDTLTLRAGGVESRTVVRLEPLPGPFEVSAHAGMVTNFGRVTAPMLQLTGTAYLPVLGDRVAAELKAGAYSTQIEAAAMTETIDARLTVMPLLAGLAYHSRIGSIRMRYGLGAGVAIVWSRVASPSAGLQREHMAAFAGAASISASHVAGPGRVAAEIGYLHSAIDGMLDGRVGGITAMLGYSVDL